MTSIQHYRERLGLTQMALADSIGVSMKTISRWESGQREPRATEILRLSRALGVTLIDLLSNPVLEQACANDETLLSLIAWLTRWAPDISKQIDEGHEIADIVVDFMGHTRWNDETIRLKRYLKEGIPKLVRLCELMTMVPDDEHVELEKTG